MPLCIDVSDREIIMPITEKRIREIIKDENEVRAKFPKPFPKLPPDSLPIVEKRGPFRR